MKRTRTHLARAALFVSAALVATPALAQDSSAVSLPPVVQTAPQAAPVQAAPVQVTPPPVVPTMIQAVPDTPKPQTPPAEFRRAAPAPRAATAERRTVTRTAPAPRAAAPAPAPEAAAPAPQPAAPAPAPVDAAAPPAAAPAAAPVEAAAPAAPAVTETRTTQTSSGALWPWLLGGALLIVAAAAFFLFRRRREEDYAEEYYEEPVVVTEPVAETPVAYAAPRPEPEVASRARPVAAEPVLDETTAVASAEDASVAEADAGDLAGIADGDAPVSNRPWLELGMRPLRAGTQAEEALVEIELIIGNAGDMPAKDVRISTFMLPAGRATSEMEELLIERANETAVPPVTIAPGEGKTVDATLAVHKAELAGDFTPVIVADARYRLPDGSEGRTSASFRIGLTDEDGNGLAPIGSDHRGMNENVAAELEGAPARA